MGPQVTAKPSGQPNIQDVLNAIQGLSNMISQLSKNQQIMESWLSKRRRDFGGCKGRIRGGSNGALGPVVLRNPSVSAHGQRHRTELLTRPPPLNPLNPTFPPLSRTFVTLMEGKGTPKDAQTQLRHKDILTTLNVYTQPIPESVKRSVEALDSELLRVLGEFGQASEGRVQ